MNLRAVSRPSQAVLILVVMEYGLGVCDCIMTLSENIAVLILVVMEYGLGERKKDNS